MAVSANRGKLGRKGIVKVVKNTPIYSHSFKILQANSQNSLKFD